MTPFDPNEIETRMGGAVDILSPKAETIEMLDIAQSLSRIPRFNGHTSLRLSVAEHCIQVARFMEYLFPNNRQAFLWGLLHDAPEAFISDIPRPVKQNFTEVKTIEAGLMKAIAERFGLVYPCPWEHELKACDNQSLLFEAQEFMVSRGEGYNIPNPGVSRHNPWVGYGERTERAAKDAYIKAYFYGNSMAEEARA